MYATALVARPTSQSASTTLTRPTSQSASTTSARPTSQSARTLINHTERVNFLLFLTIRMCGSPSRASQSLAQLFLLVLHYVPKLSKLLQETLEGIVGNSVSSLTPPTMGKASKPKYASSGHWPAPMPSFPTRGVS